MRERFIDDKMHKFVKREILLQLPSLFNELPYSDSEKNIQIKSSTKLTPACSRVKYNTVSFTAEH